MAVNVLQCKKCRHIKYAGWSAPTPENLTHIILKQSKGKVASARFDKKNSLLAVEMDSAHGTFIKSFPVEIIYSPSLCDTCSKSAGSYSEAIIQLRGNKEKIEKYIDKLQSRIRRKTFISRTVSLSEGIDFYVGDKVEALRALQNFDLDYLRTEKLVGQRKDGRRIYRSTFRVRF